jgi:hypothetical protein
VIDDLPEVAQPYPPGEIVGFAEAVTTVLNTEGHRHSALQAARDRYCWDKEKQRFLEVVAAVVGS